MSLHWEHVPFKIGHTQAELQFWHVKPYNQLTPRHRHTDPVSGMVSGRFAR